MRNRAAAVSEVDQGGRAGEGNGVREAELKRPVQPVRPAVLLYADSPCQDSFIQGPRQRR